MPALLAPTQGDTRSVLADWLELLALLNGRGVSSSADLLGALDIPEDEEHRASTEPETGEVLDQGILDDDRIDFIDSAFDEISYRSSVLLENYPFRVDGSTATLHYVTDRATRPGATTYLFCLVVSALRYGMLKLDGARNAAAAREREMARVFQVCACLAAGGYLQGTVASFGFPRAEGNAFLPALREVYRRFGSGKVLDRIPPGFPEALKDGGIDVIAWRDHRDRMPGKLYLIGQCASGSKWQDKSVVADIDVLHENWVQESPRYCTPAMFIPFPLQHDLEVDPKAPFSDVIRNKFRYLERGFGIIFDRLRIAQYAQEAFQIDDELRRSIDGSDRVEEISQWVSATLGRNTPRGAAA